MTVNRLSQLSAKLHNSAATSLHCHQCSLDAVQYPAEATRRTNQRSTRVVRPPVNPVRLPQLEGSESVNDLLLEAGACV